MTGTELSCVAIWRCSDSGCETDGVSSFTGSEEALDDYLGNLLAQRAMVLLHAGQPYPGDVEGPSTDQFLLYHVSEDEHVIMDDQEREDSVILTKLLMDQSF